MTTKIAAQWNEIDIVFAGPDVANPFTDVDAWVIFTHASGQQLRRPVFWDGGTIYRTRFASTQPAGEWQWSVHAASPQHDFQPARGTVIAGPPIRDHPHRALARGFCPPFKSNLLHGRFARVSFIDAAGRALRGPRRCGLRRIARRRAQCRDTYDGSAGRMREDPLIPTSMGLEASTIFPAAD